MVELLLQTHYNLWRLRKRARRAALVASGHFLLYFVLLLVFAVCLFDLVFFVAVNNFGEARFLELIFFVLPFTSEVASVGVASVGVASVGVASVGVVSVGVVSVGVVSVGVVSVGIGMLFPELDGCKSVLILEIVS